ncbi:MAG: OB-fold domain-containing protein [Chloroflexota bacterium]
MTSETPRRVVPQPDALTQPFWDAAAEGKLVVQRCQACGFWSHPPRIMCNKCHSLDMKWEPVSGKGRLYTWSVMHMQSITGFEDRVPYTTLLVELDEQPKLLLLSYLAGRDEGLEIGQRCEVYFDKVEDFTLPQFRVLK